MANKTQTRSPSKHPVVHPEARFEPAKFGVDLKADDTVQAIEFKTPVQCDAVEPRRFGWWRRFAAQLGSRPARLERVLECWVLRDWPAVFRVTWSNGSVEYYAVLRREGQRQGHRGASRAARPSLRLVGAAGSAQ